MFASSSFNRDPFRRLPISSAFSYPNYLFPGTTAHPLPQYTHDPYHRQHRHVPSPRHHSPHTRHRRHPRHHSHYSDTSPSSSDQDTPDEAYYMDMSDSSPLHSRMHTGGRRRKHRAGDDYDNDAVDMDSAFRPLHTKVCRRTAEKLGRDEILILPPTLTRMRVQIKTVRRSDTLRATVAGDMRFRDVVKQLVSSESHGEVRAYVKMRGAWQEPGLFLVSQIVEQGRFVLNERGELDVKIEIGGRGRGGGEGGVKGVKAWERERESGRAWEVHS